MSQEIDRFMKNARTHLPGVLDNVLQLELYNVMNDFFQQTSIWTEKIDFQVNGGDPVGTIYYIEPESTSSITRLISATNQTGSNMHGVMDVPGELTLMRSPGNSEDCIATVALTVNDPVSRAGYPEFPDWILNKYGTGLLDGILGRMMSQLHKPYSNEKIAVYRLKSFRKTISDAGTESVHRNVLNGQSWRFPQSFATRGR